MVVLIKFLASAIACVSLFPGTIAQDNLAVTGVTTGGTQPRYEIRDLQAKNPAMWNLFLQSMEKLMASQQRSEGSYYQIAGIHGAPFVSWDGVGRTGTGNGYCPHSSNLFIPWHRPYLALFEQRLAFFARRIADKFPAGQQRDTYRRAANNMRLPYWDWARKGARVMPESMAQQTIQVQRPSGQRVNIPNPLSRYRFHPLDSQALVYGPTNQWPETKRVPIGTGPNPPSDNAALERTLQAMRPNQRQSVYALLAQGGQYNLISNWRPGTSGNNFEAVHNNIHGAFADNSHMQNPGLAGFEPAFWLHHANIDRLLAIWQHLYPATYVTPTPQSSGTWTIDAGSVQDANSALTPFHRNQAGQFWTSAGVRNTRSLHYTYPELRDNPSGATLRARINRLYGSAVGVSRNVAKKQKQKSKRDVDESLKTTPELDLVLNVTSGDTVFQYTAEIRMPKTFGNQPYNVMLFLGEPSDDAALWLEDPNLVGFQTSLGNINGGDESNSDELILPANVYLTDALLARYASGELEALDRDTVVEYLTETLQWRAEQNGQAIPTESVPEIDVRLFSQTVELPQSEDGFPDFQDSDGIAPINGTAAVAASS